MDVYQLQYFKTIAECSSLVEAAKRLHVSQPSLSRCIHKMEEELGTPLFDRVGRNIVSNGAGNVVLRYAQTALNTLDAIPTEVNNYLRDKEQTVNLFAPMPLADDGDALVEFTEKHPDILLRVGVGWLTPSLSMEAPDLMIFSSLEKPTGRNEVLLYEDRLMLAVSRKNPLSEQKEVALGELQNEDFIQPMPGTFTDILHGMYDEVGLRPHIISENQSYRQLSNFVSHNLAVSIVSPMTWYLSRNETIAYLPFSDVQRSRYICLRWPENTVLAHATFLLREHLIDYYKRLSKNVFGD